ncbi:MAG: ATP phosphoribosyltransferase [Actinobacteria bacterium]|nr:ATP phosphoribosyltransferase [Actinomycetota bacterium]
MILKLGIPKGSLERSTIELLRRAGFNVTTSGRSYSPIVDDSEIECRLVRAQEMARYVEKGILDAGFTGYDSVEESEASVQSVLDVVSPKRDMGRIRWVLAVSESSPVRSVYDLEGKLVATELVAITKRYLAENGVQAKVEFSWGATKAKLPELADAIVEATETESALQADKLRVIDTVMESTMQLIANTISWQDPEKHRKIADLALLLEGVLSAMGKVNLMMNVRCAQLPAVMGLLPALLEPTVSPLADEDWVAVNTIIDESAVRILIPRLKEAGAQDIVEGPLNKIIM